MNFIRLVLILLLLGNGSVAAAAGNGIFAFSGVAANPAIYGGEFGASLHFQPVAERPFWFGPHLGALWAGSSALSRFDVLFGGEGALWLLNAVGFGLGLDLVGPSSVSFVGGGGFSNSLHYRVEPSVSIRILRACPTGAWAVRFGVPYDSLYQWGFKFGISLQLNGVSQIGGDS